MRNTIILGSSSPIRRTLLQEMGITVVVAPHEIHEEQFPFVAKDDFEKKMIALAIAKASSVAIPLEDEVVYVIAADTLGITAAGMVQTKPRNYQEAVRQLQAARQGINHVATAFCIQRHERNNRFVEKENQCSVVVWSTFELDITDAEIDEYLRRVPYLAISGALTIDGYGAQFVKNVQGSYTAILGLPVYEVRCALKAMGFFKHTR